MIANPISFSRTPARYRSPPPALGQDNGLIRTWLADRDRESAL
jgi:crotonobetainyl-CoA:carnitine CoA-transferase CaiB-like acyl-CoA transferase